MEETKRIVFEISVYVYGVKKRCRKAEKHSLKLGSIEYNDGAFNREEIEQKARDIVATNIKTVMGDKIQVQMLRVEIEKSDGFISKRFEMFDKRHVNFLMPVTELVGALA